MTPDDWSDAVRDAFDLPDAGSIEAEALTIGCVHCGMTRLAIEYGTPVGPVAMVVCVHCDAPS